MASTEQTAQLSFQLPRSLDTRVYIRLTVKAKAVLLFLTTAAVDEAESATPLGSLVYALPDKLNPSQPLSTVLFTVEPTLEFTTRLAKLLAKKAQLPVYVSSSMSLASTGLGGTMEEEMEAYKKVVEVVLPRLQDLLRMANGASSS